MKNKLLETETAFAERCKQQQQWFEEQCQTNGEPFASLNLDKDADGAYVDAVTRNIFVQCVGFAKLVWG